MAAHQVNITDRAKRIDDLPLTGKREAESVGAVGVQLPSDDSAFRQLDIFAQISAVGDQVAASFAAYIATDWKVK